MVRASLSPNAREVAADVRLCLRVPRELDAQAAVVKVCCESGNPYKWPVARVTKSDVLRHALAVGLARMVEDLAMATELETLERVLSGRGMGGGS